MREHTATVTPRGDHVQAVCDCSAWLKAYPGPTYARFTAYDMNVPHMNGGRPCPAVDLAYRRFRRA